MSEKKKRGILWAIALIGVANLALGIAVHSGELATAGAAAMAFVAVRLRRIRRGGERRPRRARPKKRVPVVHPVSATERFPVDPDNPDTLVEQMLAQGRGTLLLRPQIAEGLSEEQMASALESLHAEMALVPDGEVVLGRIDDALSDGKLDDEEIAACQGRVVGVTRLFLDRYPVTNRQFYEFVAAGGYEQMALWDQPIWPAVLDFVDQTQMPGPYFWIEGCYESGKENHPVVGVSWHEAAAYARWIGKRLPGDAEWVKAGSWPVPLSATSRVQRKYPWGEAMDRSRAKVWGAGKPRTVPVDEFSEGVSVGGVYQLIGNVWEWTSGNYRSPLHDDGEGEFVLPIPMKNIRGGAFDTYFDNQATCQFHSGENPVARKDNIGFRCAVGVCDLMLARSKPDQDATPEPTQSAPMEEVQV
ncbi:MAG: SUMF1/EgtB/PvdO family nonheme iron enzyme [Planctomycetes bacterium]|nr:SUMF1/EgtB/PvdO family nonheme iron enzyme [Planctomycetota bacterium]